jgi:soluble lytic murein transglycosylase-like protein
VKLMTLVLALSVCRAGAQDFRQTASAWAEYYARIYCVQPDFVKAVIDVESGWQPNAVSTKGAAGIMQLTVPAAFTFGVTNRFRINENIRGGVAYLSRLMRLFDGELRLVAAAYYAGEERIRKTGLNCADPDICRYVAAVERFYLRRRLAAISAGVAKGAERQCGEWK